MQFRWQFLITYSCSDWLILCCGNLILNQKNDKNENDKNTNFTIKTKLKNAEKVYENKM